MRVTTRTYAVGDIHGQYDKLLRAHALIAADRLDHGEVGAPVVHVGDLVDRGPDSRGVIEHLRRGQARGENWVVLKGNHDRLLHWFMEDPFARDPALRAELSYLHPKIGGGATLASYGVHAPEDRPIAKVHAEALEKLPEVDVAYIRDLPLYFLHGECLFVHAGIRPGIDLRDQREDDLLWIRRDFHDDRRDHGALVVHGHTIVDAPELHTNRLNIDSGAAYGGPLTAVAIEGREVFLLTPTGRQRMRVIG